MGNKLAFCLAFILSLVLSLMAYLSSELRGGMLWGLVSVICVISMHLLPSIAHGKTVGVRGVAGFVFALLFVIVATQHTYFFLQRESEAGKQRVEEIKPEPLPVLQRNSAEVANELSKATKQARWLKGAALEKQSSVVAALQNELATVQLLESKAFLQQSEQQEKQKAAMFDVLQHSIATVVGVGVAYVGVFISAVTAIALELLASLLWFVAMQREPQCEWWMIPNVPVRKQANLSDPLPMAQAAPAAQVSTEQKSNMDEAAKLLTWLRRRGEPVTVRQCLSSSPVRKKERLQPLLDELVAKGLAKFDGGFVVV